MLDHDTAARPRHARLAGGALLALCLAASGCTAGAEGSATGAGASSGAESASQSPTAPPEPQVRVVPSVAAGAGPVAVDTKVGFTAEQGTLRRVRVVGGQGEERDRLRGELSDDGTSWTASDRLEPGLRYRVRTVAVDESGRVQRERTSFRTEDLSLDQQTYPSIAPLDGETVGVGMPVVVQFDVPVTDRASIERHLSVESAPRQRGTWHWVNDHEVHWRPKSYWEPGTSVTINADINSIPAGNGIYGQLSRSTSFTVGDSVVSKVDIGRHEMDVFINGKLARTIPVSAGKPGFITRSGTKVIMEKFREKRMDAATTGISENDPEYYNIEDVEYAMRVTYSGEFLHAAPWSAGSQGADNVSHGCVGMSTSDAAWLYGLSKRGDVVEVTGSDRWMTLYNGWGDWNASFRDYREGSAL